jgi:ELWxxDGT repeat protein
MSYCFESPTMKWKTALTIVGSLVFGLGAESDVLVGPPFLVRDINTVATPGASSLLSNLVESNGVLYFLAFDPANRTALWRSDGTSVGTRLVSDIVSPTSLAVLNGVLYLTSSNFSLWKSDGTAEGTVLVRSFPDESQAPSGLMSFGGELYFSDFHSPSRGRFRLWRSDGTETGTIVLKEFDSRPQIILGAGPYVFFSLCDYGRLWRTDGTEAGTLQLSDVLVYGSRTAPWEACCTFRPTGATAPVQGSGRVTARSRERSWSRIQVRESGLWIRPI